MGIDFKTFRYLGARSPTGLAERIRFATENSMRGIKFAFTSEQAFRHEVYLLLAALPFNLESHYTSVSAAWIPQARRWIVIYSEAIDAGNDFAKYQRPIVARVSEDLVAWSDRTVIFDPAGAYGPGGFMHWPGSGDIIQSHIPPLPPFETGTTVRQDRPGWPYGAFLLNRFTEWDQPARVLTIRYLLSTSRPYQVQMMETRLKI